MQFVEQFEPWRDFFPGITLLSSNLTSSFPTSWGDLTTASPLGNRKKTHRRSKRSGVDGRTRG